MSDGCPWHQLPPECMLSLFIHPGRRVSLVADMDGANPMDVDGALPPTAPDQPPELNFDADITPEEMQMMATMGIPFGFDTTQVLIDALPMLVALA